MTAYSIAIKPGQYVLYGEYVSSRGGLDDISWSASSSTGINSATAGVDFNSSSGQVTFGTLNTGDIVDRQLIQISTINHAVSANKLFSVDFSVDHRSIAGNTVHLRNDHFDVSIASDPTTIDAQAAAILLKSFISGSAPTLDQYAAYTSTAKSLMSSSNGNPAAAWQQMGASFADNPNTNAALNAYAAMDDRTFATTVYKDIFSVGLGTVFGTATSRTPTSAVVDFLVNELSYYERFYTAASDASDPSGVARARGTLIGDLFQQIEDPRNNFMLDNDYYAAEQHFAAVAATGIAPSSIFGTYS